MATSSAHAHHHLLCQFRNRSKYVEGVTELSCGAVFSASCVQVGGYSTSMGNFTLSVQLLTPPSNDKYADRTHVIGLPVITNGTTIGATIEPGEPVSYATSTVWFSWQAPENGTVALSIISSFSSSIALYDDALGFNSSPLQMSYCSDGSACEDAVVAAGQTYAIQVGMVSCR